MSDFVIVKVGAKQYKVAKGDVISVDRLEGKEGKKLTFNEVLLSSKSEKVDIGAPYIKSAKVEAKVVAQTKGKKVDTRVYKAKSRYRKASGHRPKITKIEITKI